MVTASLSGADEVVVGVLALQGGVAEHVDLLDRLAVRSRLIRRETDLVGPDGPRVDALVLPGGESSAIDRLLRRFGLAEPLRDVISSGVPTLGTCAGLVLLASGIRDPAPGQQTFGLLDVEVSRNAFGRQIASVEGEFTLAASGEAGEDDLVVRGALIRAPEITHVGEHARTIVQHDGRVLGATSRDRGTGFGSITGISFHPELSGETQFHRRLIGQARTR